MLAFTTQVLGGFRGLIANALWIRATQLQEDDKYFEMVQLADWITKLEPHFVQVWLVQSWNMALQHLGEVHRLLRSLALGATRHRIAARRRHPLQSR